MTQIVINDGQIVVREVLETYTACTISGDVDKIVKRFQKDKTYYKKKGYFDIYLDFCNYGDDIPHFKLSGFRHPTPEEKSKYIAEKTQKEEEQKQSRKKTYEKLKKEFE